MATPSLEDMLAAINKQLGTSSPAASTPSLAPRVTPSVAAPRAAVRGPQPYLSDRDEGGGGFGGFILSKLAWLDKPRAAVMSTLKEFTDLATGKGFSLSDWKDQVDRHYGFGEYQQEYLKGIENVAMPDWVPGLGGKKLLRYGTALIGDVMTDPFMLAGGLSTYWRASKGGALLRDQMNALARGQATANTARGIAAKKAVAALEKNKNSVSSAVAALKKQGNAGHELIEEYGLDVGLRWREPLSGPILGGLGRKLLPNRTARRLAQQVSPRNRDLLAQATGRAVDSDDFNDLLARGIQASWKDKMWAELTQTAAIKGQDPNAAWRALQRSGRVPIERAFVPKWITPKPVLPGLMVGIMSSPGRLAGRISRGALGRAAGKIFNDDVTEVANQIMRDADPDDPMYAALMNLGITTDSARAASSARQGIFVAERTSATRRWIDSAVSPQGGFKKGGADYRLMGSFIDYPLESLQAALQQLAEGVTDGPELQGLREWAAGWARQGVSGVPSVDTVADLEVLVRLRQMWRTDVAGNNFAALLEIFGPDSDLVRQMWRTLRMSGDYSPGILTRQGRPVLIGLTRSEDGSLVPLNPHIAGKDADEWWLSEQAQLGDITKKERAKGRTDEPFVPERTQEKFRGKVKGRFARERVIHGPFIDDEEVPEVLLGRPGIPGYETVDEAIGRARHPATASRLEGWVRPATERGLRRAEGPYDPTEAVRALPAEPDELLDAATAAVKGPRRTVDFGPRSLDDIVESKSLIRPGTELRLGGIDAYGKRVIPDDVDKMALLEHLDPTQFEAQVEKRVRELLDERVAALSAQAGIELDKSALKGLPTPQMSETLGVSYEAIRQQAIDDLNELEYLTFRLQRGTDDAFDYTTREGADETASLREIAAAKGWTDPVNRFGWNDRQQLDYLLHELRILDAGTSAYVLDLPLREAMWVRGISQDVHMRIFERKLNEAGILFSTAEFDDLTRAYQIFMDRMEGWSNYLQKVPEIPGNISVDEFVRRITGGEIVGEGGEPIALSTFIKSLPKGSRWEKLARIYSRAVNKTSSQQAKRAAEKIRGLEVDSASVRERMAEASLAVQESVDDLQRLTWEIETAQATMLSAVRAIDPNGTLGDLFTEKLLESSLRIANHIPDLDGGLIREWDVVRWADMTERASDVLGYLTKVRTELAKMARRGPEGEWLVGESLDTTADVAAREERRVALMEAVGNLAEERGVPVDVHRGAPIVDRDGLVARTWRRYVPFVSNEGMLPSGRLNRRAIQKVDKETGEITYKHYGEVYETAVPEDQIQVSWDASPGSIPSDSRRHHDKFYFWQDRRSGRIVVTTDFSSWYNPNRRLISPPSNSRKLIEREFGVDAGEPIETAAVRGDEIYPPERRLLKVPNRHSKPEKVSPITRGEDQPLAPQPVRDPVGEQLRSAAQQIAEIEETKLLGDLTAVEIQAMSRQKLTAAIKEYVYSLSGTLRPGRSPINQRWRPPVGQQRGTLPEDPFEALLAAAEQVVRSQLPSVSSLQRKFQVGFARANRLMDLLEQLGIVQGSAARGSQAKQVLIQPGEMPSNLKTFMRQHVERRAQELTEEATELKRVAKDMGEGYEDLLLREFREPEISQPAQVLAERPQNVPLRDPQLNPYERSEILDTGAGITAPIRDAYAVRRRGYTTTVPEQWKEVYQTVVGAGVRMEDAALNPGAGVRAFRQFIDSVFPGRYPDGRPPKAVGKNRNYTWIPLMDAIGYESMERAARLREIQLMHFRELSLTQKDKDFLLRTMGYRTVDEALENIDDDVLVLAELGLNPHPRSYDRLDEHVTIDRWITEKQAPIFKAGVRLVPGETKPHVEQMYQKLRSKLEKQAADHGLDTEAGRGITAEESMAFIDDAMSELLALGTRRRKAAKVVAEIEQEAVGVVAKDPNVPSAMVEVPWSERDLSVLGELFEDLAREITEPVALLRDELIPVMLRLREQRMATDETVEAAEKLFEILSEAGPTGSFVKGASPRWGAETVLGRYEQIIDEVKRLEGFFGLRISGEGRGGQVQYRTMKQSPGTGIGSERPFGNLPAMQPFLRDKLAKASEITPPDPASRAVREALSDFPMRPFAVTVKSVKGVLSAVVSGRGKELVSPLLKDPVLRAKWTALADAHGRVLEYQADEAIAKNAIMDNLKIGEDAAKKLDKNVRELAEQQARLAEKTEEAAALPVVEQKKLDRLLAQERAGRPDLSGPELNEYRLFQEEEGPLPGGMLGANGPEPLIEGSTPTDVVRSMILGREQAELELAEIAYYSGLTEQMLALLPEKEAAAVRKRILDELASDPAINDTVREQIVENGWLGAKARKAYLRDQGPDGPLHWMYGGKTTTALDPTRIPAEGLQQLLAEGTRKWGANLIASAPNKEIADQWTKTVTEVLEAAQKSTDREQVHELLVGYDKIHNWMKAQLVATPGFVMRNMLGGVTNMWFKDIPPTEIIRTGRMMQKAYRAGDGDLVAGVRVMAEQNPESLSWGYMRDLVNTGAHSGGQAASAVDVGMVGRSRREFYIGQRTIDKPGVRVVYSPTSPEFAPWAAIRHANTFAEEAMRLATGMHAMKVWGDTTEDALYMIHKLHFDYGKLSDFERKGLRRVFPFYTWTRNNLPLQVEFMAKHPAKYNRLFSLKREMERNTPEEGTVPHYFLEPFGIRLPFQISGAQIYSVPDTPFQDLLRYDPSYGGIGSTIEQVVSQATPIAKVPVEYWAGKQVFAGIPFTERYQQVPALMERVPGLMHALQQIGWAKRNKKGEWKMQDNRIYFIGNLMPYIGVLQRAIPGLPGREERKEERYISALISTLAGLSMRMNTRYEQESERVRREIERYVDRRDRRDVDLRTR